VGDEQIHDRLTASEIVIRMTEEREREDAKRMAKLAQASAKLK